MEDEDVTALLNEWGLNRLADVFRGKSTIDFNPIF